MTNPINDCFKSRAHELTFILTQMQSYHRLQALEVTPEHYTDTYTARNWYQSLYSQLVSATTNVNKPKKLTEALQELDKIKNDMSTRYNPVVVVK